MFWKEKNVSILEKIVFEESGRIRLEYIIIIFIVWYEIIFDKYRKFFGCVGFDVDLLFY